jgi:TolB protein
MHLTTRAAIACAAISSLAAACGASAATIARSRAAACVSRIVYMREGSGSPRIMTMLADGGHVRPLGTGHAPRWSPDGHLIAYDLVTATGGHIMVMRADGTGARDLTPGVHGYNAIDPAWSPDGRWIAFGSGPAGSRNGALWLVRSDGTRLRMLVNAPGEEEHPSWSPDGSQIVFDSFPAHGPDHLYVVRRDGSGLRRLTADALDAWGPDWAAPNVILFANGSGSATDDIFTIRPDGSGLRQVTHAPAGVTYGLPSQSSDGGAIAFTRVTSNGSQVYSMTASGTRLRDLTGGQPGFNGWPDWHSCAA